MFSSETKLRVRYCETDKMGYVYYGNYAQYYEVARTEALRDLGITYRQLEEGGFMLPVREMSIRYLKPARYDDELTIKVFVPTLPKVKVRFLYECYNQDAELINTGSSDLVFVAQTTMKPCTPPDYFVAALRGYY